MSILKRRREALGIPTQTAAAKLCGLAQGTISAYENRDVRRPSMPVVVEIARVYQLPIGDVLATLAPRRRRQASRKVAA